MRRLVSLFAVALATFVVGTAPAFAGSTGTMLYRLQGGGAGTNNGDFVSDQGAMNDVYHFWVEVPPTATQLTIQIFDADVGKGATDDASDRDRQRGGSWDTVTTYSLFSPGNVAIPAGSLGFTNSGQAATLDNNWATFYTTNTPIAGHWEVRVALNASNTDDVNAFGLRAFAQAGGPELNVYADDFIGIGANATGNNSNSFTFYPYVTDGCTINHKDFDLDEANALAPGGVQQHAMYTNRTGNYTTTFNNASLSAATVWANNAAPISATVGAQNPSGTETTRTGMGIWTANYIVNEVAANNANFGTIVIGDDTNAALPTNGSASPLPNAFRIYEPTDAGGVPQLPYLVQTALWSSGPNPPTNGNNTVYNVGVKFTNPTANAITFDATHLIQARIPNDNRLTYVAGSISATVGTPTLTPAAPTRNALIQWNPGSVPAGTTVEMAWQITFNPNNATAHNLVGAGNGVANNDTLGTRADFIDATNPTANAAAITRATYGFGGLCPLTVSTAITAPTPVTLSWLRATRAGGDLAVEWVTGSEVRNVGFDLYGKRGGAWQRLSTSPIRTKGSSSVDAHSYAVTVAAPDDVTELMLEDIDANGHRTRHKSIKIGEAIGARTALARIDWAGVALEHSHAPHARPSDASPRAHLTVAADGLYRVHASDLAGAGADFSAVATSDLALTADDGPVPLRISGASGATLGAGATIEFYGRERHSLYGKRNVYTLAVDAASARRAQSLLGASAPWPITRDHYDARTTVARNLGYSAAALGDDPWYDTELIAFQGSPSQQSFTLPVSALYGAGATSVGVELEGQSDWDTLVDDHRLDIDVNGTPVTTYDFGGIARESVRFALPAGALVEGNNTATLTLPGSQLGAGQHDLVDVQSVSVTYPRRFVAAGGVLDAPLAPSGDEAPGAPDLLFRDGMGDVPDACATDDCSAIVVEGLPAGPVAAYAIGGGAALYFADAVNQSGNVRVVVPRGAQWRLVAAADAAIGAPEVSAASAPIELATPSAQLLIVSHPDFAGSLGTFVSARQAEGLTVRVVTTDQAYERYSRGQHDPEAIHQLLVDAYAAGTRYALLVGGDTYDYDGNLAQPSISFVPTPYTATGDIIRFAPSDVRLGDVDGDGFPDVSVGRWPVRTAADLAAVIQKTLAYATATFNGRAVLAAGGSDTCTPGDPNCVPLDFSALNTQLAAQLTPSGWGVDRVEIDTLGAGAANTQLVDAINQGRSLTNFVGHSHVDRWSFDPLLDYDQAQALTNANQPTIVAQWGCWSSWFVSPTYNSMAHSFLLHSGGGAAAVVGATTLVDTEQQDEFIAAFLARAADGSVRIGDALDASRRDYAAQHAFRRDVIYGINLLGDPTLKLRH